MFTKRLALLARLFDSPNLVARFADDGKSATNVIHLRGKRLGENEHIQALFYARNGQKLNVETLDRLQSQQISCQRERWKLKQEEKKAKAFNLWTASKENALAEKEETRKEDFSADPNQVLH
jgi:hypothetical protein